MPAKTRGTTQLVNKHPHAVSGKIVERIKRKKSLDEKTENKRDLEQTQEESESEENMEDLEPTSMREDCDEMTRKLMNALSSDVISDILVNKMKKALDIKEAVKQETKAATQELRNEMNAVTDKQRDQDQTMRKMDKRIDQLEQDRRSDSLIIRGLEVNQNPKQTCIITLKEKLKLKIEVSDVKFATNIGGAENRLIKLVLKKHEVRDEIYKARTKLKGSNIWITEDLTPRKAQLAYQARQAVKEGKILLTWTNDGKIFVKRRLADRPIIINDEPELLSIVNEATPTREENADP